MIVGIGCDIVDHHLTSDLGWLANPPRLKRIFTAKELRLFEIHNTNRFISGRYAAKEAVLKCLGTGMRDGIALTDIQLLKTEVGAPLIQIDGEVKKLAEEMGISSWHISISHTKDTSMAFVIAEGL